ncbi:MFS transporter [Pseudarthrobacter sp. CC12]|uniref:MFS transporter n=1 Tax=Pseudarthrobacter sp. CC12 TaxID=3029193 RepID=UPI00326301BC
MTELSQNTEGGKPADPAKLRKVISASSVGTLIEWYDFYIYGSLAVVFSKMFFPEGNATAALLISIAAFGTGFVVRPIGALVFGRMGDRIGRKKTFLTTLLLMGGATSAIGLLPTYSAIGFAAPILLVLMRLLQGLAIGGEYGGAAIYIAEHSPRTKRGGYTSVLQTTAALGLLLSIIVTISCRFVVGEEAFNAWGWRIPFLLSAVLVIFSLKVRLKMHESPVFEEMREAGKLSQSPLRDALANKNVLALVIVTMLGITAGLGVAWYTSQFYSMYFMQTVLGMNFLEANICVGVALVIGTPFFVVFGRLSDRFGRPPFILAGLALSAIGFFPLFSWIQAAAPSRDYVQIVASVTIQVLFITMIYGPLAAFLVELFPPQIRYTTVSLAYHIGLGVVGGFTPLIALAATSSSGNDLAGLIYPLVMTSLSFIICLVALRKGTASPLVRRAWEQEEKSITTTIPALPTS